MRGLPDSVVVGTYKRLTRKGGNGVSYTQDNADFFNAVVGKLIALLVKPFTRQR